MSVLAENFNAAVEALLEAIQVPDSRYEAANRAFKSVCEWLSRDESTLAPARPDTFLQGSFRLGTAIRPLIDDDDYDVDIVCALNMSKKVVAPAELKKRVGVEIKAYSKRYGMKRPADNRRCWTQEYADEAQFHIDTLPALPDSTRQRQLLEARQLTSKWSDLAIAITDKTDPNYSVVNDRWPLSNPRGYANWFDEQMAAVLTARRSAIALRESRRVDDIPTYRAKVPLQSAVQVLKFHRNVHFIDDNDNKPISVILTTLAAQSYRNDVTVGAALRTILRDMDNYIEQRQGIDWIVNPTNPLENFADKWVEYPHRRRNFYDWLEKARNDFARLGRARSDDEVKEFLTEVFGEDFAQRAISDRAGGRGLKKVLNEAKVRVLRFANHRQQPPWAVEDEGYVKICSASKLEKGFRPVPLVDDATAVSKGAELKFYARTNVPGPYEVYWQVVNTGEEATIAHGLRGGFDVGSINSGKLLRKETTKYKGAHSIECFVVKNGYLAASSGQFIVNIK